MKTNIFKRANLFFCFVMIACQNSDENKRAFLPDSIQSCEIIKGDTCNRTDFTGRKQGQWYKYNISDCGPKITDTTFYKDGNELMKKEKPPKQTTQSWEMFEGDTINLTDEKGLRQGLWKRINYSNYKVKDSVLYKDGSIVKKY